MPNVFMEIPAAPRRSALVAAPRRTIRCQLSLPVIWVYISDIFRASAPWLHLVQ